MSEPLYKTVHWGMGAGLLVCQECGALIFPEPDDEVDRHEAWHARLLLRIDGGGADV